MTPHSSSAPSSRPPNPDLSPPGITRNLTAEAMMTAARWPNATPQLVLALSGVLTASRRFGEAYHFFHELAGQRPDQPLLAAVAGSFRARLPGRIGEAVNTLDTAVAALPGLPNYFRGLVLAELPPEAGRTGDAVADLERVLALGDAFPIGPRRGAYRALARAYELLGRTEDAAAARRKAGLDAQPDLPPLSTDYWVNERDGFRFAPRRFRELAEGVHVTQGFGFGEIGFVVTDSSLVVIDAGGTNEQARAALRAMREISDLPVSHVILTHGHWDHIGGVDELRGPGVEVIAQAGFAAEVEAQNAGFVPWTRFLPAGAGHRHDVVPDRLIGEPESLTVGGVDIRLLPVHGGETDDALLVHLPGRDVVFVGDILMPHLGAPFFAEGSAEGLLDTLRLLDDLGPALLVHGHAPLTAAFTPVALAGLRPALEDLYRVVRGDITAGRTVHDILDRNHMPDVLRSHPASVLPYILLRDNVVRRVQRQHTGYWQPDLDSVDPVSPKEWTAVLELLSGGKADVYTDTIETLLERDDLAPALRVADAALQSHPGSATLAELRRRTLLRLVERHQQTAPFKFVVYSELADLSVPEMTG
ncbi:MBL fold metallo-hydrolase [Streptomyces liangshanensis]|uniref:MBL fold metallo-hydrolase n=1 Tax=Streptomyces liangshanensis TaxID=2717324 RepID=A0A6G9H691_9ACTN|nr:MBL fold metallo-hydrolase [Streptomyces liangshanensis]QIQ06053.1 MBL fold metallo-hydrolase [Streptomyces liangshanensis]